MRRAQTFVAIVPILNARVPIIKCMHKETGFSCDLSFSTDLGVCNTRILKHLIVFDFRIHPLCIILKYWMRTHQLSGTGKITNYCLFLLIAYYLQSIQLPILPPLASFQECVPQFLVDSWNLACDMDVENSTANTMRMSDLLTGFFTFYSTFKFEEHLICPLYGRTYRRKAFDNIGGLPKGFTRYANYMKKTKDALPINIRTIICVQDPFQLSRNVATCCSKRTGSLFKKELINAADLCKKYRPGTSAANFLLQLFTEKSKKVAQDNANVSKTDLVECKILPIEVEMSVVRSVLAKTFDDSPVEKKDINQHWVHKVFEFVENIFENLMKFTIEECEAENSGNESSHDDDDDEGNDEDDDGEETSAKSQKINEFGDIHTDDAGNVRTYSVSGRTLRVRGKNDLYMNRKTVKNIGDANVLKDEIAASEILFKSNSFPMDFQAEVTMTTNDKFEFVNIALLNLNPGTKKSFSLVYQNIIRVLRNYIRAFFLKYQKDFLLSITMKKLRLNADGAATNDQ